jgi:hypothetical protein
LSKIGSDWQAFEIGIGIEIGCSTAMLDSDFDPDFDKRTIRETERISDNPYSYPDRAGINPAPTKNKKEAIPIGTYF